MWEWNWLNLHLSPPRSLQSSSQPEETSNHDQSSLDAIPTSTNNVTIEHTIRFKCIGSTKEHEYQEALAKASRLIIKELKVDIFPEPNNPCDAQAISFKCHLDWTWVTVGYIVREALQDVHQAIANQDIISVKFGWIKFKMNWHRSGFGWYAGIDITKRGEWSLAVQNCASQ